MEIRKRGDGDHVRFGKNGKRFGDPLGDDLDVFDLDFTARSFENIEPCRFLGPAGVVDPRGVCAEPGAPEVAAQSLVERKFHRPPFRAVLGGIDDDRPEKNIAVAEVGGRPARPDDHLARDRFDSHADGVRFGREEFDPEVEGFEKRAFERHVGRNPQRPKHVPRGIPDESHAAEFVRSFLFLRSPQPGSERFGGKRGKALEVAVCPDHSPFGSETLKCGEEKEREECCGQMFHRRFEPPAAEYSHKKVNHSCTLIWPGQYAPSSGLSAGEEEARIAKRLRVCVAGRLCKFSTCEIACPHRPPNRPAGSRLLCRPLATEIFLS